MGIETDTVSLSMKGMKKRKLDIIQINLGDRCNLSCTHCHIDASPGGRSNMDRETAENVLAKLKTMRVQMVEFTGGGLPK